MFRLNITRMKNTLQEDHYTLLIISLSVLLRMKNVSDEICRENKNTQFVFRNVSLKIAFL
jgi:hypothetical protein